MASSHKIFTALIYVFCMIHVHVQAAYIRGDGTVDAPIPETNQSSNETSRTPIMQTNSAEIITVTEILTEIIIDSVGHTNVSTSTAESRSDSMTTTPPREQSVSQPHMVIPTTQQTAIVPTTQEVMQSPLVVQTTLSGDKVEASTRGEEITYATTGLPTTASMTTEETNADKAGESSEDTTTNVPPSTKDTAAASTLLFETTADEGGDSLVKVEPDTTTHLLPSTKDMTTDAVTDATSLPVDPTTFPDPLDVTSIPVDITLPRAATTALFDFTTALFDFTTATVATTAVPVATTTAAVATTILTDVATTSPGATATPDVTTTADVASTTSIVVTTSSPAATAIPDVNRTSAVVTTTSTIAATTTPVAAAPTSAVTNCIVNQDGTYTYANQVDASDLSSRELSNVITITFVDETASVWCSSKDAIFRRYVMAAMKGQEYGGLDMRYVRPTPLEQDNMLYVSFLIGYNTILKAFFPHVINGTDFLERLQTNMTAFMSELGLSETPNVSSELPDFIMDMLPTEQPTRKVPTEAGTPTRKPPPAFGFLSNPGLFISLVVVATVSIIVIIVGLIYLLCDRDRGRSGEYITNRTPRNSDLELGFDNPAMVENDKAAVSNGNGAYLVSVKGGDVESDMIVPYDNFTPEELMNYEVEDTHL